MDFCASADFYYKSFELYQTKTIQQYQQEIANDINGCENAVKYFLKKIESAKHLNAFVEVYENESI